MTIIVNPGAGPVRGADNTVENATSNIIQFCIDAKAVGWHRVGDDDSEGRFAFDIMSRWGRVHLVAMPGLPLARVRWTGEQNCLNFPRLYLDGNSWLWRYAAELVAERPEDH